MTKSLLCLCAFALIGCSLHSQNCAPPAAQLDIHANNIQARLLTGGDLFWDLNDGQFIPNPDPNGNGPGTIYSAGIWIGGLDAGGNLKMAVAHYRNNSATDFWPGPLDPITGTADAASCANWDKLFHVTSAQITAFQADLPNLVSNPGAALAQYPSIMGWPAHGNPYFSSVWGFDLPASSANQLAGFYDANDDNVYNPLAGDYPAVTLRGLLPFVADEIVWCVFNDEGAGNPHAQSGAPGLNIEVQLSSWAFNCPGNQALDNAVFTAHKVIYRGTEALDSCFVGFFVDPDIGCYADDYYGCNPSLDAFFAYNTDALDGSPGSNCSGPSSFGDNPPVQSVAFLSQPMEKFIGINNPAVGTWPSGTTDPNFTPEYYNYLSGHWRDESPLVEGGNGYQSGGAATDFIFPDNPSDPSGWSMCTANLPMGDVRCLGIVRPGSIIEDYGKIWPGQIDEYVVSWMVHPNADLPCGLGSTFADIQKARSAYNSGFVDLCAASGVFAPSINSAKVFPNPAAQTFTLQYGDWTPQSIRLVSADGRLVKIIRPDGPQQTEVRVNDLPNGLYSVQMQGENGTRSLKISVVH
ncbi:MAG: T9SS type A sorting domain-containing protein [Saprospiraceae bacterium]